MRLAKKTPGQNINERAGAEGGLVQCLGVLLAIDR